MTENGKSPFNDSAVKYVNSMFYSEKNRLVDFRGGKTNSVSAPRSLRDYTAVLLLNFYSPNSGSSHTKQTL
jgi:hypothetical protein